MFYLMQWELPGGSNWMNTKANKIGSTCIMDINEYTINIAIKFLLSKISVKLYGEKNTVKFQYNFRL